MNSEQKTYVREKTKSVRTNYDYVKKVLTDCRTVNGKDTSITYNVILEVSEYINRRLQQIEKSALKERYGKTT